MRWGLPDSCGLALTAVLGFEREEQGDTLVRWALRIGSIHGIAIRVHFTFLFLLAFLLSVGVLRPRPSRHPRGPHGGVALRVGCPPRRQVNAEGLLQQLHAAEEGLEAG